MNFGNGMIIVDQFHIYNFKLQLKRVKSKMNKRFTTTEDDVLIGTQVFLL